MRDKLVIIPCGKKKIWDDGNIKGPVYARQAYTGTMFSYGVKYAEVCDADWVVLSAKYGFIFPDEMIEPYDVTFINKASNPISFKELDDQLTKLNLLDYKEIIALGGVKYRELIIELFECRGKTDILTPFKGLSLGNYLHALKEAIKTEIIEAVGPWYDSIENEPVKFEDGKIILPREYWWVPTIDDAFSGRLEGPPPTRLVKELARIEINEQRKTLLDLGPRPGALDQLRAVISLIGKKLLIQMNGAWDVAPYPLEAFCVGVNLNHNEEGFTRCYMCLNDVLNRDTHLGGDDMYDGKYRLTETPDGVFLLNLADIYNLSVLEDQA